MPEDRVDVSSMRVGYGRRDGDAADLDRLEPGSLTGDPVWLELFSRWLADGVARGIPEPNAMVVATVDDRGVPATRTVLCKGVDARGVVFYTNFDSDKGRHLTARPVASATFPWIAMERQVHLRGPVQRVSRDETRTYWRSRPRGSQLGAVASNQSRPVRSRAELVEAVAAADARYRDADVELPDGWGGFRILPDVVEFWQGGADRLHDRVRATRRDGGWDVTRRQP